MCLFNSTHYSLQTSIKDMKTKNPRGEYFRACFGLLYSVEQVHLSTCVHVRVQYNLVL